MSSHKHRRGMAPNVINQVWVNPGCHGILRLLLVIAFRENVGSNLQPMALDYVHANPKAELDLS